MAFTYMLRCSDGSYYVGSTLDLDRRMDEHARGVGAVYTKKRLPAVLVWSAEFDSVADAFALEKQVQGWSRAKREALIEGRYTDLPALSRARKTYGFDRLNRRPGFDRLNHPQVGRRASGSC